MSAADIPLMGKPVSINITPRAQAAQQIYTLRNAAQQGQIQQQQLQGGALQLQQQQQAMDANKAMNDAYQANLSIGPDGIPTINHAGVAKHLADAGFGSQINGVMSEAAKQQAADAALRKAQLANNAADMEQQAQFLNGVQDMPLEQRAEAYQKVYPGLTAAAKKFGIDTSLITPQYDPTKVPGYISFGTKLADHARQAQETADLAQRIAQGLPKTTSEYQDAYRADLAGATNQSHLDAINQKWNALAGLDKTGQAASILKSLIVPKWTPAVAQEAATDLTPVKDRSKTEADDIALASQKLYNAARFGQVAYTRQYDALKPAQQALFTPPEKFDPAKTADDVRAAGLNPQQATTAKEINRHNISAEATARLNAAIAAGRLEQEKSINGMKYGPGTSEYWVDQLKTNPDSIKEMPAELRSVVGKGFRDSTGLPLPTPLGATTQTQETAARNALDGVDFIQKAMKNPEIAKNIGPIMGRIGNVEQAIGTAVHLSPEAEALAQELRTRMRYFVFQEGKSLLGGRPAQELMKQLETNSANVKMSPGMLKGALDGASANANSVLDNADKQRFGGRMRPREMRNGTQPPAQPAAPTAAAPAKSYQTTSTGPNGHKLGWNPGDATWTDLTTGKPVEK